MCVAILIPDSWEPVRLVRWSADIARAKGENLLIIRPKRQTNRVKRKKAGAAPGGDEKPLAAIIREHAGEFEFHDLDCEDRKLAAQAVKSADPEKRFVFLTRLDYEDLVPGVTRELRALRASALIVPRHRDMRFNDPEFAAERELLAEVHCETMQLCPAKNATDGCNSILVANNGSREASPALNLGAKLGAEKSTDVTALYVGPQGSTPEQQKGQKSAERTVRTALKKKAEQVASDAVVDRDVPQGLQSYAEEKGHDVIVVSKQPQAPTELATRGSVSEKLVAASDEQTVVVVRKALNPIGRFWRGLDSFKKQFIPQLDREGRVELVSRLRESADFNFDFFFLISVATMLASLGLALDSAPVVIGAMLVAPLMTPMLGVGLSVVQGNRFLAADCLVTIRRGFLAAFFTGCAVGIIRLVFTTSVTVEMSNRGAPGILDLMVAFFSGMVAAYAFGRPHLLSVLPGIAIATSLVPPVATVGLSLSVWEPGIALGAALLFLSNFVAIVLGSATCLWFVGIRGPRDLCPFDTWARRLIVGMACLVMGLSVYFSAGAALAATDSGLVVQSDRSELVPAEPPVEPAGVDEAAGPADAIVDAGDTQSAELLAEQGLEGVEVVLQERPTDPDQPATADVTLIVPGEPEPIQLQGIIAQERRPGWVTLELPQQEAWDQQTSQLTARQKAGLQSQGFFDLLERHIARRFASQFGQPM